MTLVKIGVHGDGNGALETYDTLGGGIAEVPTYGDDIHVDGDEYTVVGVERYYSTVRQDVVQVCIEAR